MGIPEGFGQQPLGTCGFHYDSGGKCNQRAIVEDEHIPPGLCEEHQGLVTRERYIPVTPSEDPVNHPKHYGGRDDHYEAIKVIRAWNLGFSLGNAVKYIARAGKKDPNKHIEDLEKAVWYIQEEISHLKSQ